ncbi:MAG: hypothetical protein R3D62_09110 [Xanthobacteraceae bacterium]
MPLVLVERELPALRALSDCTFGGEPMSIPGSSPGARFALKRFGPQSANQFFPVSYARMEARQYVARISSDGGAVSAVGISTDAGAFALKCRKFCHSIGAGADERRSILRLAEKATGFPAWIR